ncbi:MAG: DNA repair protein RecN [Lutispora sp.]|nr:DNA repair protein RecN [Lutispora sp.]MDD4834165.1 DNA repair protein RecN [Lutispora sp.]
MLHELYIKNFIIFHEEMVNLTDGFNVITGETGSGKSIIIDAIEVLCGGKFSKDDIRSGADKASIQGLFIISNPIKDIDEMLDSFGISMEEDKALLIQREVNVSGRSFCRINGQAVTLTMLKNISQYLMDIVAQNEHQLLFKPSMHMKFLDSFGSQKLFQFIEEISLLVDEIENLSSKLELLYGTSIERERKLDLLKYQIDEIESAKLSIGEFERLTNRKRLVNNSEKLFNSISTIYQCLFQGNENQKSVLDELGYSLQSFETLSEIDENLIIYKDNVADCLYKLEDIKYPIRQYKDNIEFDSGEIQIIEERLEVIHKLSRKYGNSIEKILDFKKEAFSEYESIKNSENIIKDYEKNISILKEKYFEKAHSLSSMREELSGMLENMVEKELADLSMTGARFVVDLQRKEGLISKNGIDKIEFMLAANPGEIEKPLVKVASGGEVSRVMLAIKSVLSNSQKHDCMVFDEIDAGIGGHTANTVGQKLFNISKKVQTVCITHLPQIACYADNHISVSKYIEENKTYSKIINLKNEERIFEIAKMIALGDDYDFSLSMAKELLDGKKA